MMSYRELLGGSAPTDIIMLGGEIFENAQPRSLVARFQAIDADTSDTHKYTMPFGNTAFDIIGDKLYTKVTGAALNYETARSVTVVVRATDPDGLSTQKGFSIRVKDSNDPPSISINSLNLGENATIG